MRGIRRPDAIVVMIIALVASAPLTLPQFDRLRGISIDLLTWFRWVTFGRLHDPAASPAVVVAIDEQTYRSKPFAGTPNVTWTREIAKVLTAIIDGGATTVGFDIIFPTSIEQSEVAFGNETLGERVRGFDREFLRALALAARQGKVVLGQVQHQDHPIQPSPGQRVAVGQQANIRALNFYTDPDDVVRRVPLTLSVDGQATPSMAVELAARTLKTRPEIEPDGTITLASYRVPARVADTLTLNFEGGADDIPTYSLADLSACVEQGDAAYFSQHFKGRTVLIGTVLDLEDRVISSKRLVTGIEGAGTQHCTLASQASSKFIRDSISGVYIHATAVNNLVHQDALSELGRISHWTIGFGLASLSGFAALAFGPAPASLICAGLIAFWTGAATIALANATVLPLVDAITSALIALMATIGYRFAITDRDKRRLRKSFALYLAPTVIEKMMASKHPPRLGGETRSITMLFSDVVSFSTLSETMPAADLVMLMNEYLSAMTDIIEEHGGFVDKYIGDAIVAVFGAPVDDANHALNAVRAAIKCCARLEAMNRSALAAFKGYTLDQRIGLNSGDAIVGNIGSRRRFNYTAMGDTVNLASRLEGVNKYYGTQIIASEATARLAGPRIVWRELDAVRVSGRTGAINIFEAVAELSEEPIERAHLASYAHGLARWRDADFLGAIEAFAHAAEHDPPSAHFLARAKRHVLHPPGPDWLPVNNLEGK
jgi:class 3 adenylate cyclase/CHASE2 domain-containing sensor protein